MPGIRIDDELYQLIKDHAEPFKDSPNTTLRDMLGLDEHADKHWSFQQRLFRLGNAIVSKDDARIAEELRTIELSYRHGTFGS